MSPDLTISIYALTTIMANVEEEKFSLCLCVVYVMFVSVVSIFLRVKIYSPLFHFFILFSRCLSCPCLGKWEMECMESLATY